MSLPKNRPSWLRHLMPDGREVRPLIAGKIAWRNGDTYISQTLGDTDLWVLALEPK